MAMVNDNQMLKDIDTHASTQSVTKGTNVIVSSMMLRLVEGSRYFAKTFTQALALRGLGLFAGLSAANTDPVIVSPFLAGPSLDPASQMAYEGH